MKARALPWSLAPVSMGRNPGSSIPLKNLRCGNVQQNHQEGKVHLSPEDKATAQGTPTVLEYRSARTELGLQHLGQLNYTYPHFLCSQKSLTSLGTCYEVWASLKLTELAPPASPS